MDRVKILEMAAKYSGMNASAVSVYGPKFATFGAFENFYLELIAEVLNASPESEPQPSNEREDGAPQYEWVSGFHEEPKKNGVYRTSERHFDLDEDMKPSVKHKVMYRRAVIGKLHPWSKEDSAVWSFPADTPEDALTKETEEYVTVAVWVRDAVIEGSKDHPSTWNKVA